MREYYFVKTTDLDKVLNVSPWCPCSKRSKGLHMVRLDPSEADKVKQWVWRVEQ